MFLTYDQTCKSYEEKNFKGELTFAKNKFFAKKKISSEVFIPLMYVRREKKLTIEQYVNIKVSHCSF